MKCRPSREERRTAGQWSLSVAGPQQVGVGVGEGRNLFMKVS